MLWFPINLLNINWLKMIYIFMGSKITILWSSKWRWISHMSVLTLFKKDLVEHIVTLHEKVGVLLTSSIRYVLGDMNNDSNDLCEFITIILITLNYWERENQMSLYVYSLRLEKEGWKILSLMRDITRHKKNLKMTTSKT
jgi:hypothetical protein